MMYEIYLQSPRNSSKLIFRTKDKEELFDVLRYLDMNGFPVGSSTDRDIEFAPRHCLYWIELQAVPLPDNLLKFLAEEKRIAELIYS